MKEPTKELSESRRIAGRDGMGAARTPISWAMRQFKIRPRLIASIGIAIAAFFLFPVQLLVQTRVLAAFDVGTAAYLVLMFIFMLRAGPDRIRRQAQLEDQGRWAIIVLAAAAAGACLVAIGFELHAARETAGGMTGFRLALAGATVLLAWLFVHTNFSIHYAHEYYGDAKRGGEAMRKGLIFPEEDCPDYWDFLYFSFVIGATCQVSDVQITSRGLRRWVLFHGVLAFIFNTLILALAINIAASAI